ncbi:MAG TPA: hypothetical protein VF230_00080 [Acidimicrobiales bacterium]
MNVPIRLTPRCTASILCDQCGGLMDLEEVRKVGYDREIRCESCGILHRWSVAARLRHAAPHHPTSRV